MRWEWSREPHAGIIRVRSTRPARGTPVKHPEPPLTLSPAAFRVRLLTLAGVALLGAVPLAAHGPIPQDPAYHHFRDDRTLLGVPNALNVLSNLPFLLLGVWGLWFLARHGAPRPDGPFLTSGERWPYTVLFVGVLTTCLGSMYYHLDPTDARLVWDRLPMTVGFMGLFASIVAERIGPRVGDLLLSPLVAAGAASVAYWYGTEQQGRGDLRPYILVQFYPLAAVVVMGLLFPPRYTRGAWLFAGLGLYVLAKVCEDADARICGRGGVVSGHTLKHLPAAGGWCVLRMLQTRRPARGRAKGPP